MAGIATYLRFVHKESLQRGYHFDSSRIAKGRMRKLIPETKGQLLYEWSHLLAKLQKRTPDLFKRIRRITNPKPHPLYNIVPGEVRDWEKQGQNP